MANVRHSPTSSRTQHVRSLLDVLVHGHGQPGFTSDVQHSFRVDSCHEPSKIKRKRLPVLLLLLVNTTSLAGASHQTTRQYANWRGEEETMSRTHTFSVPVQVSPQVPDPYLAWLQGGAGWGGGGSDALLDARVSPGTPVGAPNYGCHVCGHDPSGPAPVCRAPKTTRVSV